MTNPPRVEPRINVNCIITPILHPLQSRPDDFCSATYPQQPHGIIEKELSMKQFTTIEKLDTGILYLLELASSLSVLLLAFGLIASMANVLTKGSVLTDNLFMQRVWAWTQCIAVDASIPGTILTLIHMFLGFPRKRGSKGRPAPLGQYRSNKKEAKTVKVPFPQEFGEGTRR